MSTDYESCQDQDQAATLLQKGDGVNQDQAKLAATVLFKEQSVTPIRQAIASGDYYQAYQDAKSLQQQGDTSSLQEYLNGA